MVCRIRTVLVAFCLTVLLLVVLLLLLEMAPWEPLRTFAEKVTGRAWVAEDGAVFLGDEESAIVVSGRVQAIILVLSLAAVLAVVAMSLYGLRDRIHITKEGEDGSVTIVESAITRYIKQVALDIKSVQKVRSVITSTNEGLVVNLRTRVLVTETLPRIERAIRERVRRALEETLGVGGVAAINVVIEDFEKAPGPAEPASASETVAVSPPALPGEEAGMHWTPLFRRRESIEEPTPTAAAEAEDTGDREALPTPDAETAEGAGGEEPAPEAAPHAETTRDNHVEDRPWTQTSDPDTIEKQD